MSKYIAVFTSLMILYALPFSAQAQYYRSKNFEKEGVNEYIAIVWGSYVGYWTSTQTEAVELKVTQEIEPPLKTCLVSFPNHQAVYKLEKKEKGLLCTHPDGKQQWFELLPTTYRSKGFEKPGVIEYIESDFEHFVYFTNLQPNRKIKLQRISSSVRYPIKVRFPNDDQVYTIDFQPICFGALLCKHPDGREQVFEFYLWDGELK